MPGATLIPRANDLRIDSADMLYIENTNTDTILHFQWAKKVYDIKPGHKKLVPFEVICLYYGDPRSRAGMIQRYEDSTGTGQVPERMAEVQRLCVRYGIYEQGMDDIIGSMAAENEHLAKDGRRPLRDENLMVRIFTQDDDEIIPPLFDHTGMNAVSFTVSKDTSQDLATIVLDLQRRLGSAEAELEAMNERGDNDAEIPVDEPAEMR